MNIMELGAIGELVGGLAVIASLVYVGVQVRQNTRAQNIAALQFRSFYAIDVGGFGSNSDLPIVAIRFLREERRSWTSWSSGRSASWLEAWP